MMACFSLPGMFVGRHIVLLHHVVGLKCCVDGDKARLHFVECSRHPFTPRRILCETNNTVVEGVCGLRGSHEALVH